MRAFVVAHARPFVDPTALAAFAFVEVEKPGHASLQGGKVESAFLRVIARSAATKQSSVSFCSGLLRFARNDDEIRLN